MVCITHSVWGLVFHTGQQAVENSPYRLQVHDAVSPSTGKPSLWKSGCLSVQHTGEVLCPYFSLSTYKPRFHNTQFGVCFRD